MSADDDPTPVESDDEVLGYECPECGTVKMTEEGARTHCDDSAESGPESDHEVDASESGLSTTDVREYHQRVMDTVAPLGTLDGNPTLLINDKRGWYVTRENTDPSEDEVGEYAKERRPRHFNLDYRDVVGQRLERTLYALTSYKDPEAFNRWEPARFNSDTSEYEYLNRKPTPTIEDTVAVSAWGDIDLADELKLQRDNLDDDTYAVAEATLEAYIDAFADLYGGRDAVYALDSVGGAYVFGAPEATLPISQHYEDDEDARGRVLSAFIDRTNEYLQNAEADINDRVEGARETVHPDWANNVNRQYKMPMTLHGDLDAVVTPLDVGDVRYREPVAVEDVDDGLLTSAREWCEALTDIEHTDRVGTLIETLWPDEYAEHGDWKAALDAWVEAEREQEERERQRRQAAAERREKRLEELGNGFDAQAITPFLQDVYDAIEAIDTAEVVEDYASDGWDTGTDATGKTEFDPSWRESSSGSSCYVNHDDNRFGDPSANAGGYAPKAMALGKGIIRDAGDELTGEKWAEAVDALRDAGYEIPIWTPEKGSKRHDGDEFEKMPFWAVREAAVALDTFPEDGFVQQTNEDGTTYPGFPGPGAYNNALAAIEEAGLDHGREYADEGPTHPVYALLKDNEEAPDLELHLIPKTGKEVDIIVERDGRREYKEEMERGFWSNANKRSRVGGRVRSAIDGVPPEPLKESVKDALTQADLDSDTDDFEDKMRSPREQDLRTRTLSVVCWPSEEETEWVVDISPPDGSTEEEAQRFTFDSGQMHNADPGYFATQHIGKFFEKINLDSAEWFNLTDHWLDIQETKNREADPRKESAVEEFKDKIETMEVWADKEGFDWGGRNALYEPAYDRDEDAVLVPGRWVVDWLHDSDYGDMNFSKILRERGIMLSEAKQKRIEGRQGRVWPISAEETNHSYERARRVQDEDDEDAPEGMR